METKKEPFEAILMEDNEVIKIRLHF